VYRVNEGETLRSAESCGPSRAPNLENNDMADQRLGTRIGLAEPGIHLVGSFVNIVRSFGSLAPPVN
jgi:hypothetical protein